MKIVKPRLFALWASLAVHGSIVALLVTLIPFDPRETVIEIDLLEPVVVVSGEVRNVALPLKPPSSELPRALPSRQFSAPPPAETTERAPLVESAAVVEERTPPAAQPLGGPVRISRHETFLPEGEPARRPVPESERPLPRAASPLPGGPARAPLGEASSPEGEPARYSLVGDASPLSREPGAPLRDASPRQGGAGGPLAMLSPSEENARSGGSDGGASGGGGREVAVAVPSDGDGRILPEYDRYYSLIRQKIGEHLLFPAAARRRELSGTVLLEIALSSDGRVGRVTLLRSSSHPILDEAAIESVKRAAPFTVPSGLPPRQIIVRLPIVFEVR